MATIHVQYRRVVQHRQFESQEIVLRVEEDVDGEHPKTTLEGMAKLYKDLERIGDKLLADALAKPDLSRPGGGR